jgi:hypothetical protein
MTIVSNTFLALSLMAHGGLFVLDMVLPPPGPDRMLVRPVAGSAAPLVARLLIGLSFSAVAFPALGALIGVCSPRAPGAAGVSLHLGVIGAILLNPSVWSDAALHPQFPARAIIGFRVTMLALSVPLLFCGPAPRPPGKSFRAVTALITAVVILLSHTAAAAFDLGLLMPPPFVRAGGPAVAPFLNAELIAQNLVGICHVPAIGSLLLAAAGAASLRDAAVVAGSLQLTWGVAMVVHGATYRALLEARDGVSYDMLVVLHFAFALASVLLYAAARPVEKDKRKAQ